MIFFEQLEIDYVLSQDAPQNETTADNSIITLIGSSRNEIDEANRKFEKDNRTARGHLLNHMSNSLFDLFINQKSAKIIWETLEKKYGADDAGKKKYVVGNWLRFQMVDDKPIMEQVHVYENLVTEVLNEGMKMCEILQANVLLEKFPPLWNDYRNQLKHKKRDLSLQELISHMRTEEANRLKDKQNSNSTSSVKVNLVESGGTSKNRNNGKEENVKDHQRKNFTPRQNDHKIQKPNGSFYVCGKGGHKAYQCKDRKDQQNQRFVTPQANLVEDEIIAAVVVETNLVEDKSSWIMDSGASRHLCNNKRFFHQFEEVTNGG